jgi:uncharacterized damage-inducible protein DinB
VTEPAGEQNFSAEAEAVLAVLERNRRTFAWKTGGLDRAGLAATTAATTMTLGGLVKHMALVETDWLVVKVAGDPYGPPWDEVDFDADPDWEWRTAAQDDPEQVYALWRSAVQRSRDAVAAVLYQSGLDAPTPFTRQDGRPATVQEMLLDMIEEYARHTGHADLLRESVDGLTGEGPPADFRF